MKTKGVLFVCFGALARPVVRFMETLVSPTQTGAEGTFVLDQKKVVLAIGSSRRLACHIATHISREGGKEIIQILCRLLYLLLVVLLLLGRCLHHRCARGRLLLLLLLGGRLWSVVRMLNLLVLRTRWFYLNHCAAGKFCSIHLNGGGEGVEWRGT